MSDLSYFNLGFRSESILEVINKIEQGVPGNKTVLADAVAILEDCVRIEKEDGMSSNLFRAGYELSSLVPLIFDIFPDMNTSDIMLELKGIISSIDKLIHNNPLETTQKDSIEKFFSSLSQLCLSRLSNFELAESMAAM